MDVQPLDPSSFAAALAVFGVTALIASLIPARQHSRSTRQALRSE